MTVGIRHLEFLYGLAGAREKFEEMTAHLIRSQHPAAERVRIVQGDGGIDVHEGKLTDPAGVDVFQIKYFPLGIGEAQRGQIRDSFKRVRDNKEFRTRSWTLCLPVDMSVDEKKWFEEWVGKQSGSGIEIRPAWGATQFERLLILPENQEIRETYFRQEDLRLLRDMGGHLRQLLDEFVGRVPKPEPIVLEAQLQTAAIREVSPEGESSAVIVVQLGFEVQNTGPKTARAWDVIIEPHPPDVEFAGRYTPYPNQQSHQVLLPGGSPGRKNCLFGFRVLRNAPLDRQLKIGLFNASISFHTVSEDGAGEPCSIRLADVVSMKDLERSASTLLRNHASW
jgi:hypothetical protein